MKGYKFLPILCFLLFSSTAFSRSKSQTMEDSIESKVLDVTRKYSVYLPKSYSTSTDKKYPVLYLLHGHSHRNHDWIEDGKLQEIADKLINSGEAEEMIIVTPDAGRVRDGYFNTEGWAYETFFFEEFIPFIENKYRIISSQSARAIAGFSMGGGGATAYALKHPQMFSSVYAMSALMTLPKQERAPMMNPEMAQFGTSILANDCINLVTYFDLATLEKLRQVRWFVDCGDDDFLLDGNLEFHRAMREAKVPCELRIRDGNHDWKYWSSSLYIALPFVSEGFRK